MSQKDPPRVDGRGYEEIREQIRERAPFYTPHWRFTRENPDPGSALASVFARYLEGSVERLNRTPQNHKTAFYNTLGASRRPARPAAGAVCFSLASPDVEGTLVPRDFKLYSPVMDETGTRYSFETQREIFVTPARLSHLLYADAASDTLCRRDEGPFELQREPNRQRRGLVLFSALLERARADSRLYLTLSGPQCERWRALLSDPARTLWTTDGGREVFCLETERGLLLHGAEQAASLRLEAQGTEFLDLPAPEGMELSLEADGLTPDAVFVNTECRSAEAVFAAFGDSYSQYDALYLQCEEALCQTGAHVTLSFTVDFSEALLGEMPPRLLPKKLFVPKHKYPPAQRPDILIEEVAWEYFNGVGYAPLPLLSDAETPFRGVNALGDVPAPREYTLRFLCPDISPALVGAESRLCIRARLVSIRNAYVRPARMLIPRLSGIRFAFRYPSPLPVSRFCLENSGETQTLSTLPPVLFPRLPEESPSLYFVFDRPPTGGPIGMLALTEEDAPDAARNGNAGTPPTWWCWTGRGWQPVPAEDETDGLRRTGLVTLHPASAPARMERYGCAGYWFRLSLPDPRRVRLPGLFLNSAPVLQCDSAECYSSDSALRYLQLPHENVLDQTVYLNTAEQEDGPGAEEWTLCEERGARLYSVDRVRGRIEFHRKLRLPATGRTVKVRYRHGGGVRANLPAGTEFVPALALGYVQTAQNPLAFQGGAEPEAREDAERRAGEEYRHKGRPVTAEDYENLAREADMAHVTCATGPEGAVTLVILMRDHHAPFEETRARVQEKLLPLLPLGVSTLTIRPPVFVRISVSAVLALLSGCSDTGEAEAALEAFFDPLMWAARHGIGCLPETEEIRHRLLALPHINGCRRLFVRYYRGEEELPSIPPFALPLNGSHTLSFEEQLYA